MLFQYPQDVLPPDAIRLLRLFPAEPSKATRRSPLRCALDTVRLHDAGDYTALSYTWGDQSVTTLFEVNGADFRITTSLHSALLHLRLPDQAKVLWIDQICINQKDNEEKSSQVRLMGQIYSRAHDVVAWLGEERDESATAMRVFQRVGQEAFRIGLRDCPGDEYISLYWHVNKVYSISDDAARNRAIASVPEGDVLGLKKAALCRLIDSDCFAAWDEAIEAIYAFVSRPYFQRGWIKQEIAIPERLTLQCGHQVLAADHFVAFIRFDTFCAQAKRAALVRRLEANERKSQEKVFLYWPRYAAGPLADERDEIQAEGRLLNSDTYTERHGLGQTVGVRSRFQLGGQLRSEMTLVFLMRVFMAHLNFEKPEDRVFGLLGMASDAMSLGIAVDYSLRWEDVYADAVKHIVQSGYVDIITDITYEGGPASPSRTLASWVPDFRNVRGSRIRQRTFKTATPFSAGGKLDAKPGRKIRDKDQYAEAYGVLLCRGVVIDTITKVGTNWLPDAKTGSYYANFQGYIDIIKTIRDFSAESAAAVEQLDISDPQEAARIRARRLESAWRVAVMDQESFDNSLRRRRATREQAAAAIEELFTTGCAVTQVFGGNLRDYLNQSVILEDYAPFLGAKGFMGLGAPRMEAGDIVCVLYGATVAFVLRPVGGPADDTFRLVGEAYCDTIMDGEALDMGFEERTFRLV